MMVLVVIFKGFPLLSRMDCNRLNNSSRSSLLANASFLKTLLAISNPFFSNACNACFEAVRIEPQSSDSIIIYLPFRRKPLLLVRCAAIHAFCLFKNLETGTIKIILYFFERSNSSVLTTYFANAVGAHLRL